MMDRYIIVALGNEPVRSIEIKYKFEALHSTVKNAPRCLLTKHDKITR